jgi:heptosyltransferase-2
MSLPALRAIRRRFPDAHIAVLARPWVAGLYSQESSIDRLIPYVASRWRVIRELSAEHFDCAILLQNAFEAALLARLAGIPRRIGYSRDARGWLLTDAIPVPKHGEIPRHERFYYLELLRRAGIVDAFPPDEPVRLEGAASARERGLKRFRDAGLRIPAIGVSPGAAYGHAKRWIPERFAQAAWQSAKEQSASIALFGSAGERALCQTVAESVRKLGGLAWNLAGQTSLPEFIDLAAACRLFLTNDSGAMHVASGLGVPTIAIFGPTDDTATGPTGFLARVVREPVECSPCLLRECPIDHRCMTRVTVDRVTGAALELWTLEAKS